MKKENFEINKSGFLKGGTREACVIVREALTNSDVHIGSMASDSLTLGSTSAVSIDEFLEAVRVLMAFSYSQEDTIPERYECVDADCANNYHATFCHGEFSLDNRELTLKRKPCPYYREQD